MSDLGRGHLLGMGGGTQTEKMSHPCLTTPFVTSPVLPLSLHSLSALSTSILSLTLRCNLLPRSLTPWSVRWLVDDVDDPYCVEVMELSAVPFLSGSLTYSLQSSLPHFELRKPRGRLFAVNHMPAIPSYLLWLCFCKYGCQIEEKDGGR